MTTSGPKKPPMLGTALFGAIAIGVAVASVLVGRHLYNVASKPATDFYAKLGELALQLAVVVIVGALVKVAVDWGASQRARYLEKLEARKEFMRRVLTVIIAVALLQSASAAPPPANGPWPEVAQRWIKKYRTKPEPMAVPAVIRGLSQHGTLKEPESSGLYVGFISGVLSANPKKAWTLIEKSLPLPFEDQWILIRAVAYSGLPEWKDHMRGLAMRLPDRQEMVQRYLSGDLPPLSEVALEKQRPGTFDKVKSFFNGDMFFKAKTEPPKRQITFESNADLIEVP